MNKIQFEPSKMEVRFRVVGYPHGEGCLLFSSESYGAAEDFCWRYTGTAVELHIEKVWIRKVSK